MKVIWKYTLDIVGEQVLTLPVRSQLLCVQIQHKFPCLWVVVEENEKIAKKENRTIYMCGTGTAMGEADGRPYIGTVQITEGAFVYHFFDGGVK